MVKLQSFRIFLNNPQEAYFGGQFVHGHVEIGLKNKLKFDSVFIQLQGRGQVEWSQKERDNNKRKLVRQYKQTEEYINSAQKLLGTPGVVTRLPPGVHRWEFRFQLPFTAATSFEGSLGTIRYALTAVCKISGSKKPKATAMPITVIGLQDLNKDPSAVIPLEVQYSKPLGLFMFKNGNLTSIVRMPFRGFVPGQPLGLSVELKNQTDHCVKKITVELWQAVAYHGEHEDCTATKSVDCKVTSCSNHEGVGEKLQKTITFKDFKLPPVPPMMVNTKLIDIYYTLRIKIHTSGLSSSLSQEVPIIVGTIPIVATMPPQPNASAVPMWQSNNDTAGAGNNDSTHRLSAPIPLPFDMDRTSTADNNNIVQPTQQASQNARNDDIISGNDDVVFRSTNGANAAANPSNNTATQQTPDTTNGSSTNLQLPNHSTNKEPATLSAAFTRSLSYHTAKYAGVIADDSVNLDDSDDTPASETAEDVEDRKRASILPSAGNYLFENAVNDSLQQLEGGADGRCRASMVEPSAPPMSESDSDSESMKDASLFHNNNSSFDWVEMEPPAEGGGDKPTSPTSQGFQFPPNYTPLYPSFEGMWAENT